MQRLITNKDMLANIKKIVANEDKKEPGDNLSELKGDFYYNTRQMVAKNKRLYSEGKIDKCRFFEFKGYKIYNPFKDEKGEKDVDPKEYYGDFYMNSDFNCVN